METTCINCPMGCALEITQEGDKIIVTGNTCKRGETYGISEFTSPVRMVTSLIKYKDCVTSVRTSKPVKKSLIFKVLEEIKKVHIQKDLVCGDVVIENVAGSDADIIVTGNI